MQTLAFAGKKAEGYCTVVLPAGTRTVQLYVPTLYRTASPSLLVGFLLSLRLVARLGVWVWSAGWV